MKTDTFVSHLFFHLFLLYLFLFHLFLFHSVNPSALLPNRTKIATALNNTAPRNKRNIITSFRSPSNKMKSPAKRRSDLDDLIDLNVLGAQTSTQASDTTTAAEMNQGLRSLSNSEAVSKPGVLGMMFALLASSAVLRPLHVELFILATRVFCQLTALVDPTTATHEVLNHPSFSTFVQHIATSGEPFVHSAATQLFTALLALAKKHDDLQGGLDNQFKGNNGLLTQTQLEYTRLSMRDVILEALGEQSHRRRHNALGEASFLLELLIVVLSEQPGAVTISPMEGGFGSGEWFDVFDVWGLAP